MSTMTSTLLGTMNVNSTNDNAVTLNMTTAGMLETTSHGRTFRFEDYTQRAIMATIICLVAVVGSVGNVMVLLAVILSRKLQTRTNVFVVNLAVADLVTCFSAPFTVVALLSKVGWPMPEIVCSIMAAIGFTSLSCSIMNLAAIAINRYVLITKTTATYRSIYTPKKITVMVVFTWVYPALVCCLPFLGVGKWGYSDKYKTCTQDTSHETSDFFSLIGSVLIYPVPLIILSVCYFKIYRHVTSHMRKMMGKSKDVEMADTSNSSHPETSSQLHKNPPASFSKRQVEITKNLFYVFCAFVACLAPFFIALTIPPSDPVIPWTGLIIIFNSAINPIIYGAKHPHFKEVFRHMLRCRYHMVPEPSGCLRKIRSKY
ncbi:alpha-1B adrenergic receptor-like [Patiria miniata]|uniref:G-protein coupled receptors family 1 profile domain-containing protein n=1 Tax=Patiria miniata TaxID=46514 RepID=A0A914BAU2_PATMI|nr:alpha-1B adrenergic receptor-like [Patiria miniata]